MSIIEDPHSTDKESGLPHRSLAACELSFFCQKARGKE